LLEIPTVNPPIPPLQRGARGDFRAFAGATPMRGMFYFVNILKKKLFPFGLIAGILFLCGGFEPGDCQPPTPSSLDQKLFEAVEKGHAKRVKELLAKGARVNSRNEFGDTPLHVCQSRGVAELLLAARADIHAKNREFGMTPLFNAPLDIGELLIARGADINVRAKEGLTPLAWAAYGESLKRMEFLIAKGADVNAGEGVSKTPLHIAVNWGRVPVAAFLLSKGARVNARDGSGWTPLHSASLEGSPAVAELLILRGAEKNAKTISSWSLFPAGSTAVDIAERVGFSEMAGFLKAKGVKSGKDLK